MPEDPLTKRLGYLDGNTEGSVSDSSKLGTKSTVSLLISRNSSAAILPIFASV
jgi:hypothetical protein